ncbi:CHAT domain-containing protein [Streptomyces canarius]
MWIPCDLKPPRLVLRCRGVGHRHDDVAVRRTEHWGWFGLTHHDDRDAVRARLLARVRRYLDHADVASVHTAEAYDEVVRLGRLVMARAEEQSLVSDLQLVGWLLLCRLDVLSPGQRLPDVSTTARLLAPVHRSDPRKLTAAARLLVEAFGMAARYTVPETLAGEADRLVDLAGRSRQGAPAQRAVELLREALEAAGPDHPDYTTLLDRLGCALRVRYDLGGTRADLDAAVRAGREAVALGPRDPADRALVRFNLGLALALRYDAERTWRNRQAALDVVDDAEAAIPPDGPSRQGALHSVRELRAWIEQRPPRSGEPVPQARPEPGHGTPAVEPRTARERGSWWRGGRRKPSVDATGEPAAPHDGSPGVSAGYRRAARAAEDRMRAVLAGDGSALDAAIEQYRRAIGAADGQERAAEQQNLGAALVMRFRRDGDRADLDAALAATRRAVALAPGEPDGHVNLLNGSMLRHSLTGDSADLHTAVEAGRRALALLPPDAPDRSDCAWQ